MKKHFAKLLIATLSIVFAVSLPTKDVNAAAKKNVTTLIDPGHGGSATVDETGKAVPAVNDLTL